MKSVTILILSLLLLAACARNPRPESPEQRAQQEARYLQGGEQAAGEPRTIVVREQENDDDQSAEAPAEPPPSEAERKRLLREQARAQVRAARQAASAVAVDPLLTPAPTVGGNMGLLR